MIAALKGTIIRGLNSMRDIIFGLTLIASSVAGIIVFYKTLKRGNENKAAVWLMLLAASAVLWTVTYALFYLLPKNSIALFFIDIRYLFVMTTGWLVFLFVYRTLSRKMYKRSTLLTFSIFPIINLILLLTNSYTHFFIDYSGFIEVNGIRALAEAKGLGFIYHCIFSYVPFLLAAVIVIVRYIRLPKKQGRLLGWLFLGMIIVFAMTMLAVLNLLPYPIDLAPYGVQVTIVIYYIALFHSKSMDMMFISRNIIFENASSVILILDTDSTIVDSNKKANEVAKRLGITDLIGMQSDMFIETWQKSSQSYVFEEEPTIFAIVENEMDYHYQIQVNDMAGKDSRVIGSYMEIKNISPIMSLIHMLQDAAYYDNLTGLPNRNYFSKKLPEIDKPESLPLCVIVGDVNGLKGVNDAFGHVKGDLLLKCISSMLLQCAPADALLSRMGGDEFVGLFPHTTAEQTEDYIRKIETCIEEMIDPELKSASIALGYKIKTTPDERIEELIKAADIEMYTTKRNRRASDH